MMDMIDIDAFSIEDKKNGIVAVNVGVGNTLRRAPGGNRNFTEASGSAKCDAADSYDREIGYQLALGRALRQLGRQIIHNAQAEVHHRDKALRAQKENLDAIKTAEPQIEPGVDVDNITSFLADLISFFPNSRVMRHHLPG